MSRQEIDRILSEDLDNYSSPLQNIDCLTSQLSENSNFLAQFQMLLKQQIQRKNNQPTIPPPTIENELQSSISSHIQSQKEESTPENETNKQQIIVRDEIQNKQQSTSIFVAPTLSSTKTKLKHFLSQTSLLKQGICIFQEDILKYLKQEQQNLIQFFTKNIQQFIAEKHKQYQHSLSSLQKENITLKLHIEQLQKRNHPLTQRNQISHNGSAANQTKQNCLKNEDIKKPSLLQSSKIGSVKSIIENTSCELYSLNTSKMLNIHDQLSLPEYRPLKIGVPPVQNGFGMLKSGSQVVYRGMWKNGKFSGKGYLSWQNYIYEGDFKDGLFDGFGKLSFEEKVYLGKFCRNKAEGDGTLLIGQNKIYGSWKSNLLTYRY